MSTSRSGAFVRGLLALAVLVALTIGVPLWLLQVSGNPIPDTLPSWGQASGVLTSRDDGTVLLGVLKYAAWAGWALFVTSVIADLLARLRGLPVPRLGPQQHLASQLIAAVTALAVALPTAGTAIATPAPSTTHALVASAPTAAGHTTLGDASTWRVALNDSETKPADTRPAAAAFTEYTVRPGDCLWDIAWNELGDPERWPELYETSRHIKQPNGVRMSHADHIEPGWTVLIPGPMPADLRRPASSPSARRQTADLPSTAVITPLSSVVPQAADGPVETHESAAPQWAPPSATTPTSTSNPSERISTPLSLRSRSHPQTASPDADWGAAIAQHDGSGAKSRDWRARLAPSSP